MKEVSSKGFEAQSAYEWKDSIRLQQVQSQSRRGGKADRVAIECKVQHVPDGNRNWGCIMGHLFPSDTLAREGVGGRRAQCSHRGSWLNLSAPPFCPLPPISSSRRWVSWGPADDSTFGVIVVRRHEGATRCNCSNADLIRILGSWAPYPLGGGLDLRGVILVIASVFLFNNSPYISFCFIRYSSVF